MVQATPDVCDLFQVLKSKIFLLFFVALFCCNGFLISKVETKIINSEFLLPLIPHKNISVNRDHYHTRKKT